MNTGQVSEAGINVEVRNIGGINQAEITLPPGVSVLSGRNATNRTSFLLALMTGLGSKQSSLKRDADEGSVTLQIGDETYDRSLKRHMGYVEFSGNPYTDTPELADLFAFLLENNEARQAVARGDNLREIIMRPIDMDRIDAKIEEHKRERETVRKEIEQIEQLQRELPTLEEERRSKQEQLKEYCEELDTIEKQLGELDTDVDESQTRKEELERVFQRIRDAQSEYDDLEFDLKTERSTLEDLRSEREALEDMLSEIEDPNEDLASLENRIGELRQQKNLLDNTITEFGSVINFNEEMLENDGVDMVETGDTANPTDALVSKDTVACWTCGSTVDETQIQETLDDLRELRSRHLEERGDVQSQITELSNKRSSIRDKQSEIEQSNRRLSEVDEEIDRTKRRIRGIEQNIKEKENEIQKLEQEAEEIDVEDHEETLQLHREANKLELRIERLRSELSEIEEEITNKETAIERKEELEAEREEIANQLTELRTRIDRIEEDAVNAFNDHMETILDILEYENIERIWIERREVDVREGRKKVTRTRFELHSVRVGESGSVYEDSVDHLSESEREVTGLIFALAGYLVHDVHEEVPFIILDSLEAIDSNRIARLIGYFRQYADYLVTALLPEDAEALPEEYTYIKNVG